MAGDGFSFFWGLLVGAGVMWLLGSSGLWLPPSKAHVKKGDTGPGQPGQPDQAAAGSAAPAFATVAGLAVTLKALSRDDDRLVVLRNRLPEIQGRLSGGKL